MRQQAGHRCPEPVSAAWLHKAGRSAQEGFCDDCVMGVVTWWVWAGEQRGSWGVVSKDFLIPGIGEGV